MFFPRRLELFQPIFSDDDDWLNDPEIQEIHNKRLYEMKMAAKETTFHLGKGHGQYREIVEAEFLPEVPLQRSVFRCYF